MDTTNVIDFSETRMQDLIWVDVLKDAFDNEYTCFAEYSWAFDEKVINKDLIGFVDKLNIPFRSTFISHERPQYKTDNEVSLLKGHVANDNASGVLFISHRGHATLEISGGTTAPGG